jgi:hypothetical protein
MVLAFYEATFAINLAIRQIGEEAKAIAGMYIKRGSGMNPSQVLDKKRHRIRTVK